MLLAIALITMWVTTDDECPELPTGPTTHGCTCLPETSVEDPIWG
jgi:hypothetical protein